MEEFELLVLVKFGEERKEKNRLEKLDKHEGDTGRSRAAIMDDLGESWRVFLCGFVRVSGWRRRRDFMFVKEKSLFTFCHTCSCMFAIFHFI